MPRARVSAAKCWRTCGDELMSRIGKQPIEIPGGVEVTVGEANVVTVKGPRGTLTQPMHVDMRVFIEDGQLRVERPDDEGFHRSLHGLTRSLLANMVAGVTEGFQKQLQIVGVGYRAALKGKDLEVQAGYSHPVLVTVPEGIEFEVPTPTQIIVRGNGSARRCRGRRSVRAWPCSARTVTSTHSSSTMCGR